MKQKKLFVVLGIALFLLLTGCIQETEEQSGAAPFGDSVSGQGTDQNNIITEPDISPKPLEENDSFPENFEECLAVGGIPLEGEKCLLEVPAESEEHYAFCVGLDGIEIIFEAHPEITEEGQIPSEETAALCQLFFFKSGDICGKDC